MLEILEELVIDRPPRFSFENPLRFKSACAVSAAARIISIITIIFFILI